MNFVKAQTSRFPASSPREGLEGEDKVEIALSDLRVRWGTSRHESCLYPPPQPCPSRGEGWKNESVEHVSKFVRGVSQ
jgi:hypothetical protein